MAKSVHFGVAGKARKGRKLYIGIAGKARKAKKAYVGIGGKARLFFAGDSPGVGRMLCLCNANIYGNGSWKVINAVTMALIGDWPGTGLSNNAYEAPMIVGTEKWFCTPTAAYDPLTGAIIKSFASGLRFRNLDSLYSYELVSYRPDAMYSNSTKISGIQKLHEDTFAVLQSLSTEILGRAHGTSPVGAKDVSGLRAGTCAVRFYGSGWGSDRDGYQRTTAEYSVATGAEIRVLNHWVGEGANTGEDYQYDAYPGVILKVGDGYVAKLDASTLAQITSLALSSTKLNTFRGLGNVIKPV